MEKLITFILSDYNTVYLYSILIMFGIFILELVSILAGLNISGLIDDALPDFDLDGDLDMDIDVDTDLPFHHAVLHWFNIGNVPFLVLVIIFLTTFGLTGFIFQYFAVKFLNINISSYILVPLNILFSFYVLHKIGGIIGRLIPSEETTAISQESFIGRIAEITTGTSKKGMPAQAKIQDEHGRFHYIMTEPLNDGDEFPKGTTVLIVDKKGRNYLIDEFDIK
ncbi:MAG: YqiJ family protein [Desulfobacterales bacterium]|nr:YqiJ family protein [Desulfobacterales bacterium]